jgi:hypothetical protein
MALAQATASVNASRQHITPDAQTGILLLDGDQEPSVMGQLREDLAIMSRLLDKAINEANPDGKIAQAMGLPLIYFQAPLAKAMYLEDYGVLFMLQAGFPLVAPAAETNEPETPASETDSAWEAARREVYGLSDPATEVILKIQNDVYIGEGGAAPYDAERVEKLQEELITSLKNASRIRNLSPDRYITVCITGPGSLTVGSSSGRSAGRTAIRPSRDSKPRSLTYIATPIRHAGGSMMLIRVRKSDVDAFAAGSSDQADFTTKVQVTFSENTGAAAGSFWNAH